MGIAHDPSTPPRTLALRLMQPSPSPTSQAQAQAQAQAIHDWLLRLEALRYARQQAPNSARFDRLALAQLQREFKQLHWPQ
jgi:hypothetical protein